MKLDMQPPAAPLTHLGFFSRLTPCCPLSAFISHLQAVLSDVESGVQLSGSEHTGDASEGSLRRLSRPRTPSPQQRSSPGRGRSPRQGPSPACSDSSMLALIHSALHKRQLQVQVGRDQSFLGEVLEQPGGGARILGRSLNILGWSQSPGEGLGRARGGTRVMGVGPGSGGRSRGLGVESECQEGATESESMEVAENFGVESDPRFAGAWAAVGGA